jgi:hypothetical protein
VRPEAGRRAWRVAAALGLAGAGVAAFWAVRSALAPPEGPVPVPWDRVRCVRCGMLVGAPAFAGQIHADGRIQHFDDPGCLLLYAHEHTLEDATSYFRHRTEDRWLAGDEARFVPVPSSPMGYDLGADDAAASALSYEAALARVLERERARRSP